MKISVLLFVIALLIFSGVSYSQFMDKGEQGTLTTVETRQIGDYHTGILEGYIVKKLHDDHYAFRDKTGEIEVEIKGGNKWWEQLVGRGIKFRIYGHMDHGSLSSEFKVKGLQVVARVKSPKNQNSSYEAPKVHLVRI